MGILSQIFRRKEKAEVELEAPPCPHTALVQRWDRPEDMGKAELATYVCDACGAAFEYEQAQALMQTPPSVLEDTPAPPEKGSQS